MNEWPNDKFPRPGNSAQGNYWAYSVEARHNYHSPKTIYGQTFDREWRRVDVHWGPNDGGVISVPRPRFQHDYQDRLNLLTWEQANALRWLLHCAVDERGFGHSLCLETRIVEHKVKYEFSEEIVAAYDPMGGDDFGGCRRSSEPYWPRPDEHSSESETDDD